MKLSKEDRAHWTKEQKRAYKSFGITPNETTIAEVSLPNEIINDKEPIIILCVKFGTKYGTDYVEKLRNMVSRHITVPYEFVCLTDDNNPISGVRSIIQRPSGYSKLWWHKVHMFDPSLPLQGRILYMDLDVVIHNNLDKLVQIKNNHFYGIRDFNRKFYEKWNSLNSSVMSWIHGSQSEIFDQFMENKQSAMRLHGDQDWIWKIGREKIKFWPDEWIQSYKWEIRSRDELTDRTGKKGFKLVRNDVTPNKHCCIAVFHGDPKPEDIRDSFVIDNWR